MDECLTKPVRKDVLLAMVGRFMTRESNGFDHSGDGVDQPLISGGGGETR
jgi:hypothetical protein